MSGDESQKSAKSEENEGVYRGPNKTTGAEEFGLPAKVEEEEEEFQRFVKSAPGPVRGFLMQVMRMQRGGPVPHPLFDKFTPQHVDKFLDYSHEGELNEYSLERSNRRYYFAYAVLFVALLVFLIVYLAPVDKNLLGDILKMLAVFAGGFGTGFGTKSFFGSKN